VSSTSIVLIILVALAAVVAVVYMLRKPAGPELPEAEEPERLPAAKPGKAKPAAAAADGPAKKASARAAEAEPAKAKADKTKAAPSEVEKPASEKKPASKRAHADEPQEPKDEEPPAAEQDDEQEPAVDEEDEQASVAEAQKQPPPPPSLRKRDKDVKGLRKGLSKVREEGGLFGRLKALFGGKKEIDPGLVQEMEEILLTSDVGVKTTAMLLDGLQDQLDKKEIRDSDRVWQALRERAAQALGTGGGIRNYGSPTVVLMVGVNGTGKTTTIGKLAKAFKKEGRKVLLVAGDTFRAAAVEQLKIWGMRVGCDVFSAKSGADPSAVVFDAIKQAVDTKVDLVLVDTAGRLHTKTNLMEELSKMVRTAGKALPGSPHETLLVVDATTGQNALQQASTFKESLPLTGIVLTKLDGTAKGGIVLGIRAEHDLAVRYIGVGERAEDLRDFDAEEFVEAMLGLSDDAAEAA
jgi:fused signal recognition particle receptor